MYCNSVFLVVGLCEQLIIHQNWTMFLHHVGMYPWPLKDDQDCIFRIVLCFYRNYCFCKYRII